MDLLYKSMQTELYEIIQGTLLGDGYLCLYGRSKNAMYKFKQSKDHLSYVEYIYNKLESFVSCGIREEKSRKPCKINNKINHDIQYWNGEYCISNYFWSKAHAEFTSLYNEWYPYKKKIIPRNLKLTPRIISHWYADDGFNNVTKNSKGVFLYTNGFTLDDIYFLNKLLNDYGFESKVYGKQIRIMSGSYFKFIDLVKPYILEFKCFDYKIDISNAPKDMVGGWPGFKLNPELIFKIKTRFKEGVKQKDLIKELNLSKSTIYRAINKKNTKTISFSGTADVKIGYKFNGN